MENPVTSWSICSLSVALDGIESIINPIYGFGRAWRHTRSRQLIEQSEDQGVLRSVIGPELNLMNGVSRLADIVRYSLADGIATLTMDDGKVNAMTPAMSAALNDGLDRAAREAAVVVIRGRENVFCGGFDLTIMRGADDALKERMVEDGRALLKRLYLFPRPVIFVVTGHAVAMGALLVLAGDFRVGLAGDFRIGLNETRIGLTLPAFGVEIARDRLAPTALQRATVNAELFSPENAVSAGFLDRAVGPAEFDAAVAAASETLSSLDADAFGETKRRVRQSAFERVSVSAD